MAKRKSTNRYNPIALAQWSEKMAQHYLELACEAHEKGERQRLRSHAFKAKQLARIATYIRLSQQHGAGDAKVGESSYMKLTCADTIEGKWGKPCGLTAKFSGQKGGQQQTLLCGIHARKWRRAGHRIRPLPSAGGRLGEPLTEET